MGATLAIGCLALAVEALIGYPRAVFRAVGHPVTWMGALVAWLDRHWNRDDVQHSQRRLMGAVALAVLLVASGMAAWAIATATDAVLPHTAAVLFVGLLASSCLAQRSLDAHVRAVADALESKGIAEARRAVAAIVGRETAALDPAGVSRAAIESLAENFADGIVAPAFWLAIFGLAGGILYKAVNTADSMIGHRTPRHAAFGFCAAKLDDAASWPGARLAAFWLAAAAAFAPDASTRNALHIARRDARGHPSPNAGWPEAAMAGALGVRLAGPRTYGRQVVDDAFIGDDTRSVDAMTIRAALRLYRIACALQLSAVFVLALVIALWR